MRESKIFIFLFLWIPLQMSFAVHFFPIELLVFFLLICKNSLYIKALILSLSHMLHIFVDVCCHFLLVIGHIWIFKRVDAIV